MPTLLKLLFVFCLVAFGSMPVSAAISSRAATIGARAETIGFARPVADAVLAGATGGFERKGQALHYGFLSDNSSTGFIQQTTQNASIAMDIWWTEIGTPLIGTNLIGRQ